MEHSRWWSWTTTSPAGNGCSIVRRPDSNKFLKLGVESFLFLWVHHGCFLSRGQNGGRYGTGVYCSRRGKLKSVVQRHSSPSLFARESVQVRPLSHATWGLVSFPRIWKGGQGMGITRTSSGCEGLQRDTCLPVWVCVKKYSYYGRKSVDTL